MAAPAEVGLRGAGGWSGVGRAGPKAIEPDRGEVDPPTHGIAGLPWSALGGGRRDGDGGVGGPWAALAPRGGGRRLVRSCRAPAGNEECEQGPMLGQVGGRVLSLSDGFVEVGSPNRGGPREPKKYLVHVSAESPKK